jgi:N,N'-diacetyllegionaminate synthase
VLLSSGMSGLEELDLAAALFRSAASPLAVLQCTSEYPCPPEHVNLRAMVMLGERLGSAYGLSDHTLGIETALAAVALGASVVEKHFTLSKRLYGPDHHASLEPEELRRLVVGVRRVEAALGSDRKERDSALDSVRATFEKSIVTATSIAAGAVIERSMLTTKRPGTGIPATRIAEVLNRRARRDIDANALLAEGDLA